MSKSIQWKARRSELITERMEHARKKLFQAGISYVCPNDLTISFRYNCETVLFYPYTGWFTGKSVKDGRGLRNLLNQITSKNESRI